MNQVRFLTKLVYNFSIFDCLFKLFFIPHNTVKKTSLLMKSFLQSLISIQDPRHCKYYIIFLIILQYKRIVLSFLLLFKMSRR